jgi:hypothetical protein
MRIWEKKFNDVLFVAVVVLVGTRVLAGRVFHDGLIFQLALIFAGFAAAVGIIVRGRAVVRRYVTDGNEQSR